MHRKLHTDPLPPEALFNVRVFISDQLISTLQDFDVRGVNSWMLNVPIYYCARRGVTRYRQRNPHTCPGHYTSASSCGAFARNNVRSELRIGLFYLKWWEDSRGYQEPRLIFEAWQ